jgi:uncharacterized protein (TIGR02678 family)
MTSDLHRAARALLRTPLLRAQGPAADDFRLVRRHESELRAWFERNTGWPLRVDAATARLARQPGDTGEATHPARDPRRAAAPFSRRRYVLFCLALAVLERGESQTALGRLADQIALEAADPQLAEAGVEFTLDERDQRTDLIAVVRLLLHLGVLTRVAGDEEAYLRRSGDALYDVERRVLAGLLAASHGPSTVRAEGFEERLAALTAEAELDSGEARNRRIRHRITRRLLDDPVLYFDELGEEELAYLTGQRGAITRRITELTGLAAEVRAEGIAMVDPEDDLTDVRMPEQGTHGHVTLLLAEHLARTGPCEVPALRRRVRELAAEHAGFWSRSAREPGAEEELTEQALVKLTALRVVSRRGETVVPRPALARFALGEPVVRASPADATGTAGTASSASSARRKTSG